MGDFDLIVRGGTVVTPAGPLAADVGVVGEQIRALGPDLSGTGGEVVNAAGLHVFPGVIDAHVHFNEPGRAHWEGLDTGSRAVAAGGGTMFFDMPLNAHPPTIDAPSFRLKLAAAEKKSVVDYAFWGGLVPRNLDRLAELADCGVIGFKAFMAGSGIDDFPCVDDRVLREGMKRAAQLRLPVAVHAESEALIRQLTRQRVAKGRTTIRDYLASRPIAAEIDARKHGADVSCETCPHYLSLTGADLERLGPIAKCAPPLRSAKEQERLWQQLLAGELTTVGSDHSPCPPDMKENANFFEAWGGISGAQHVLPILLTEAHFKRAAPLALVSGLLSGNVAKRFSLPETKGRIAVGADADLALVNLGRTFDVEEEELFYRYPDTPYLSRRLRGRVVRTLLRGRTIFNDGDMVAQGPGRLIRPVK